MASRPVVPLLWEAVKRNILIVLVWVIFGLMAAIYAFNAVWMLLTLHPILCLQRLFVAAVALVLAYVCTKLINWLDKVTHGL